MWQGAAAHGVPAAVSEVGRLLGESVPPPLRRQIGSVFFPDEGAVRL